MKGSLGLGIDVGGTYTKLAVVDESGRVLRRDRLATASGLGPASFTRRIADAAENLLRGLSRKLAGVGLGLAGDTDPRRRLLRFSPSMRELTGWPLGASFERRLAVPVTAENDGNMAVWGGFVVELRRRPGSVIGVTLGTGVGGGLILDGKLHTGATGSAGEIGHLKVRDGRELCRCGARGCLEAYAGAYAIVRRTRRLLSGRGGKASVLRRLCPDLERLEPRHLSAAARRRDPIALRVWEEVGEILGAGIAGAVYLVNPEVVLLMGGVARAGELVLGPIRRVLARQPFKTAFGAVEVRVARAPDLGAVGAGLLGLERAAR